MAESFFHLVDESPGRGTFSTTPAAAGPWSMEHQHGGPPNALLVRTAERLVAAERVDVTALRLAAEFLGPVPMGEIEVTAAVRRSGRSALLVEAALSAQGRECLHARIWFVGQVQTPAAPTLELTPDGVDLEGWSFPYGEHLQWQITEGSPFEPGPATAWVRPRVPLVPGEILSGLQRAALIGDSASGISSALAWSEYSFANVDFDLHLARDLVGDWLQMQAETVLGGSGAATCRSILADRHGPVGGGLQTLVIRAHASRSAE